MELKANERVQGALGHPKNVEPSTCRSWPIYPSRVIRHVQKVQCGRGKAFYAAAGGQCARWSCPPPGVCRSRFWVARLWTFCVQFAGDQVLEAPGKKRTHTCASSTIVGSEALCPVKVALRLYRAATQHSPVGAHPLPGMRSLWPAVSGKFVSKRVATVTVLPGDGARLPGHCSASHGSGWC